MTETTASQAKSLQCKLPEIAAEVDRLLQSEYIKPQGGLVNVIMGGGRPRAQLTAKLHELARQVVQRTLAGPNTAEQSDAGGGRQLGAELRSRLASATPALLEFGGTRQVLAVLPRDTGDGHARTIVSDALGTATTITIGDDNDLALCVEAGQLSVQHVAAALVEYRRDRVEFAGRVHSRTDVTWTPLIAMSPIDSMGWPGIDAGQSTSRDAMCKTLVM